MADESTSTKSTVKLVPLNRIVEDHSIQVRVQIDPAKVSEYTEIIKEHGSMEPMVVFYEGDVAQAQFLLSDGYHRIRGYRGAGIDKAPCQLRQGGKSEALKFAITRNCRHGATMTNADKRRAAELAVLDPVLGQMTDAEIAKMIGVSSTLVYSSRKGETLESKKEARKRKQREEASDTGGKGMGPAVQPVITKERKGDRNIDVPTRAQFLKMIEDRLNNDLLDEEDLIKLCNGPTGDYVFLPKKGGEMNLKIVGTNGRKKHEATVQFVSAKFGEVTLRLEGDLE
jgi:ParB-like chromosome segregation protein Spo0J